MNDIKLIPLAQDDREQFILDNQEAFNYGALEEFGRRDDHFEEDGINFREDLLPVPSVNTGKGAFL